MEPWDVARVAVATVMLAGAAISDWRTRRVPNAYWYPFAALAVIAVIADLVFRDDLRGVGVAVAIAVATMVILYGLWWVGLLFGGADAKAFMVLAALVPFSVADVEWQLTPTTDALFNATVATLVVPLMMLLTNLLRGKWGGWATFLAVPMNLAAARRTHVWPLERIEDGEVVRKAWQKRSEDLDVVFEELEEHGVTHVWATPKIPFLIPAFFGWLFAVFFGNLVLAAVAAIIL